MAKDIERVSVNKFEQALNKDNIVTDTLAGTEGVTFQVKKTIGLSDMVLFVQEVVEACVDAETGDYIPEAFDFAIRVGVLTHYANFAMPASMEKQYTLVYDTKAFEQVMEYVNQCQFNDIIQAINKKIKYMLDVMSASAITKIHEVIDKFNEIAETGNAVFGNSSPEELSKFIGGVSKLKDMNEAEIAKAVINAKDGENNG